MIAVNIGAKMYKTLFMNKQKRGPPLPQRLQEVRRAKFTFPHLKRAKSNTLQKNEDKETLLRGNYLLSEQTQSPLLPFSLEDMFQTLRASFFCSEVELSRGRLVLNAVTGHPSTPK